MSAAHSRVLIGTASSAEISPHSIRWTVATPAGPYQNTAEHRHGFDRLSTITLTLPVIANRKRACSIISRLYSLLRASAVTRESAARLWVCCWILGGRRASMRASDWSSLLTRPWSWTSTEQQTSGARVTLTLAAFLPGKRSTCRRKSGSPMPCYLLETMATRCIFGICIQDA